MNRITNKTSTKKQALETDEAIQVCITRIKCIDNYNKKNSTNKQLEPVW